MAASERPPGSSPRRNWDAQSSTARERASARCLASLRLSSPTRHFKSARGSYCRPAPGSPFVSQADDTIPRRRLRRIASSAVVQSRRLVVLLVCGRGRELDICMMLGRYCGYTTLISACYSFGYLENTTLQTCRGCSPHPVIFESVRGAARLVCSGVRRGDCDLGRGFLAKNDALMGVRGVPLDLRAFLLRGHSLRLYRAALRSARRAPAYSRGAVAACIPVVCGSIPVLCFACAVRRVYSGVEALSQTICIFFHVVVGKYGIGISG